MTTQPKALATATLLREGKKWICANDAAAELERQHAEIERLEAVNAELLEVCRQVDAHYSGSLDHRPFYVTMARLAISKAEGESHE